LNKPFERRINYILPLVIRLEAIFFVKKNRSLKKKYCEITVKYGKKFWTYCIIQGLHIFLPMVFKKLPLRQIIMENLRVFCLIYLGIKLTTNNLRKTGHK